MKRTIALAAVALTFAAFSAQANAARIVGYISDSMCGAKHMGTGAACVKKCVEGGMAPVFVDVKSKSVWKIDNPDSVKDYYGAKVVINGTADDSAKSVHIDSVKAAK